MLRFTLALTLLAGATQVLPAQAQTTSFFGDAVQVQVDQLDTNTTWFLSEGESYALYIRGVYSYSANNTDSPLVWLSGSGNGEIPHGGPRPDFPFGCVYARIGDGGVPFLISEGRTFEADTPGELILSVNDNNHTDNFGTLVAVIYGLDIPAGVDGGHDDVPTSLLGLRAQPNPGLDLVELSVDQRLAGDLEIVIVDAQGRHVRSLEMAGELGGHRVEWNRRDDFGSRVSAGVYFARATAGSAQESRKIVLR